MLVVTVGKLLVMQLSTGCHGSHWAARACSIPCCARLCAARLYEDHSACCADSTNPRIIPPNMTTEMNRATQTSANVKPSCAVRKRTLRLLCSFVLILIRLSCLAKRLCPNSVQTRSTMRDYQATHVPDRPAQRPLLPPRSGNRKLAPLRQDGPTRPVFRAWTLSSYRTKLPRYPRPPFCSTLPKSRNKTARCAFA